jgi:uncharacterized protein (DUF1501 family)
VLVSIFLRGGADGLTLCVPHGDVDYYRLRPTLALPRPDSSDPLRVIDLDGFFGFPKAMEALIEPFKEKSLLVAHATGLNDPTRSHFNAMYFMEVGRPNPPASQFSGWIGNHLLTTDPMLEDAVIRGLALGYGLPRSLAGGPDSVPVRDLAAAGFSGDPATARDRRRALESMYAAVPDPMRSAAETTLQTVDLLERIDFRSYQPAAGAVYPEDELGYALKSTAALIKAGVGVEAATIDYGGWDTHENQGPREGAMAAVMKSLAEGLAAFHKDAIATAGAKNVVVTVQTEFGRNAFENASGGTDHGHAGVMMLMGKRIRGGRVLAQWPSLADGQRFEDQDLQVTIDYRDLLGEVAVDLLGNSDVRNVFPDPGYTYVARGVTAA